MDIRPDLIPRLFAAPFPLTSEAAHALLVASDGGPPPSRAPARDARGASLSGDLADSLVAARSRVDRLEAALREVAACRKAKQARDIATDALES